MNLIELDQVTKVYRRGGWSRDARVEAVAGASLAVPEGTGVGLIGRSGSGKSTLGRMVLGLERPDSGAIRYRGNDLRAFGRQQWKQFRREVQVVFQNALGSVNPRWPVEQIIGEPLRNFERLSTAGLRARTHKLLHMVGLDPADAGKYPHQFSGGQLQRVCIARALAPAPRLIVLDEAVSSLDMLMQARILKLLRDLRSKTSVSYLFVSHDIRIVAGFCDLTAVMHQGRITSLTADLSGARKSGDPVLRELAGAVLPAWPGSRKQSKAPGHIS